VEKTVKEKKVEKKLNILVLAGGLSEEREVSLASARAVTESLIRQNHHVEVVDSADGRSLLDSDGKFLLEKDTDSVSKIALKSADTLALTESLSSVRYKDSDLIFLALHGGHGEDGTIQAVLDLAGMKYTGSGMLASATAMNKAFAKQLVRHENILTPDWLFLKNRELADIDRIADKIAKDFTLPVIIKPNNSGSTVGLTLVKKAADIPTALEMARKVTGEVLVEQYIKGREITASVIDGDPLPLVEIIPVNELYDYQCKYTKGKSQYICPAEIPEKTANKITTSAVEIYSAIGCDGLVRVDYIMDDRDDAYFLEVNTLPGMTELSLAPMAAKETGMDFDALVDKICRAALEK